jgi:hypothetical protein
MALTDQEKARLEELGSKPSTVDMNKEEVAELLDLMAKDPMSPVAKLPDGSYTFLSDQN